MFIFKRKKLSRRKLRKHKKLVNRFKARMRRKLKGRKRRKINRYKLKKLRYFMSFLSPEGKMSNLGEAHITRKEKMRDRTSKARYLSTKVSLNLFKITYDMLLNYHCPLGKRRGEWSYGVMLTNIFMIRNRMSILDITNIFFELRKMVNRIFKAVKLRKGVALLNGRRYGWRRFFTFIFEKWLPGFFTNFHLNMTEMIGYFIKRRFLTRRQKARAMSLKAMCLDKNFLASFRYDNRELKQRENKLINFMKLPSVSLSLIDNTVWLRECQKEGISAIQIIDSNSQIERVDYPIISNQKSVAFLSFITALAKEITYQARRWEITRLKKDTNSYIINSRLREAKLVNSSINDYFWLENRLQRYTRMVAAGYKMSRTFPAFIKEKVSNRSFIVKDAFLKRYVFNKIDKKIKHIEIAQCEYNKRFAKFIADINKKKFKLK